MWRIWKADNLWKLQYPCGYAQHPDYDWIRWKAQQLWEDIYEKEGSRGVPS